MAEICRHHNLVVMERRRQQARLRPDDWSLWRTRRRSRYDSPQWICFIFEITVKYPFECGMYVSAAFLIRENLISRNCSLYRFQTITQYSRPSRMPSTPLLRGFPTMELPLLYPVRSPCSSHSCRTSRPARSTTLIEVSFDHDSSDLLRFLSQTTVCSGIMIGRGHSEWKRWAENRTDYSTCASLRCTFALGWLSCMSGLPSTQF